MSRTYKDSPRQRRTDKPGRRRNISVRAVRRDPPDYRRLSQAVVESALAQAEADAQQTSDSPEKASAPDEEPHD